LNVAFVGHLVALIICSIWVINCHRSLILGKKIKKILETSRDKFSQELSIRVAAGGGTVYAAIEKGLLAPGRRFPRLPRLPRVLAGSSLGFLAGQYLYIYTSDCTDRFRPFSVLV
jgi:hypothetical protein